MLSHPVSGAHIRLLIRRRLAGAWPRILLVLAFLAALGGELNKAAARDVDEVAAPSSQWCFSPPESGDHPICYGNMFACVVAAFAHAASCTERAAPTASTEEASTPPASAPVHAGRRRAQSAPHQHKFTAAERNELYRKFQEWQEPSAHE
jgi:hypothetical protein